MRTSSRARVSFLLVTVLGAFGAATASAQDLLYLRAGGLLSSEPPAPGAVTAVSSLRIPNGEDALLGSFTTAPVAADVVLGQTRGVVYLGTGRPGMDGCARVTMSLSRFTGSALFVVASGTVETTIRARRHVVDPIVVPMLLADALVAATGDRLVFDVRVANECGGERTVALLYDSVARASALELYAPGATTSTTTTTVVESTTTTTTLPPTCLETATGLAAVRCRLEVMDGILRTSSPASLGGPRFLRRLSRRVERALFFVRAAELVDPTPRRIRKGRRHLGRFLTQLARGLGDGRVAREVGEPLASLGAAATAGLDASLPVR